VSPKVTESHALQTRQVPVAELRTFHKNPRHGNTDAIARSLQVNGQYKPIVVNAGTHTGRPNEVLAGNHTLIAARDLGWPTVAVVTVDVDDDQASRIVVADNRTADLGGYDERLMLELLADLPDLDGTGYDPGDVDALEALLAELDEGDDDPQSVLDESDRAGWPIIRAQVPPEVHARFSAVAGDDDANRIRILLDMAGVS
jgi:ParB-like chromosome segregation protein Spo0J